MANALNTAQVVNLEKLHTLLCPTFRHFPVVSLHFVLTVSAFSQTGNRS